MTGSDISKAQDAQPASDEAGAQRKARPARTRAPKAGARPGAKPVRKPRPAAEAVHAEDTVQELVPADASESSDSGSVEGYGFADVISGELDAAEERDDAAPAKRVLLPQVDSPKLHKVLAQAGLGSRLEMERSEEHTSELQSHLNLVCRLLLEKKKKKVRTPPS